MTLLFDPPLAKTTEWIKSIKNEPFQSKFEEYRYQVNYHLWNADHFATECASQLYKFCWTSIENNCAMIGNFDPLMVLTYGDIALREASSTLDNLIGLINHLYNIGIPKRKLCWNCIESDLSPLKPALTLKLKDSGNLSNSIDIIFKSYGYALLREYRNWITHRGAPSVKKDWNPKEVPIPTSILQGSSIDEKGSEVEHYLHMQISKTRIVCYPFVPKCHERHPIRIEDAAHPMEMYGIKVGKGGDMLVEQPRIHRGSLLDNENEYLKNNQVSLEDGSENDYAGEPLAIYFVMDYINGVQSLVEFVENVTCCYLDEVLVKSCQESVSQKRDTATQQ